MNRQFSVPVFGILVLAGIIFGYSHYRQSLKQPKDEPSKQILKPLRVELPEVVEGLVPLKYTCEGEGSSPELKFTGIPKDAKSLAIVVDDKDAALGVFTHWMLWNIDSFTENIKGGETPSEATVGKNGYGKFEWGAICPSPGPMHHYRFKVYALSDYLDLPVEEAKPADLVKATNKLLVGYGEIVALFGK